MQKLRIVSIISMVLISTFVSYKIIYWVGENYFFDKLFYQKSVEHGYWLSDGEQNLESFGKRSRDLITLKSKWRNQKDKNVMGVTTQMDEIFTIVVIGDSYVWGQGLREDERFVNILEGKLNKIRPTEVISLGNSGDSFSDNFIKFQMFQSISGNADLFLFGFLANDLKINEYDRYDKGLMDQIYSDCDGEVVWSEWFDMYNSEQVRNMTRGEKIEKSLEKQTKNYCSFQNLLPLLPKENTIYLDFDGFRYDWYVIKSIKEMLVDKGLEVFSFDDYVRKKYFYKKYFPNDERLVKKSSVSPLDGHPSAWANKIYAEALFEEITENPKTGFSTEN